MQQSLRASGCILMLELAQTVTNLRVAAGRRLRRAKRSWRPAPVPPAAGTPEALALEHVARAEARKAQRDDKGAEDAYCEALQLNPRLADAHIGLAMLRLPGPHYLDWLAHFHATRRPPVYLEIGVASGHTLALAKRPTRAIGIDPAPTIEAYFTAETHLYRETSDCFFGKNRLAKLLNGDPVALGLIDGLHTFEQALKDFINLEAHVGRDSVILMHDTIPPDEKSQERVKTTWFHSGDVWKVIPCLKRYRPDLRVRTIATAPTGLTMITGLDPGSRALADRYDEAVAEFIGMPYAAIAGDLRAALNIVPNEWNQAAV